MVNRKVVVITCLVILIIGLQRVCVSAECEVVPLHRYWHGDHNDHFYTTDWSALQTGGGGYRFENIVGNVLRSENSNCMSPLTKVAPLYRYWNSDRGQHFYTSDWAELGPGRDGWKYETQEGYVGLPINGSCEGYATLYRYWNQRTGDHLYTTDVNEGRRARYRYEGITGCICSGATGSMPCGATYIRGKENRSKCFHKRAPGWTNGNPIHIWDCGAITDSAENKTWVYEASTGYIRGKLNPSKCLHKRDPGWTNGNPIHIWDCGDSTVAVENKTWIYEASTGYIRGKLNPSKCLHKRAPGWANGNPIHIWDCGAITDSAENKTWIIDGIDERTSWWGCAHCNDGSCQCGKGTKDELCANHNGNDPEIGCIQQQ